MEVEFDMKYSSRILIRNVIHGCSEASTEDL